MLALLAGAAAPAAAQGVEGRVLRVVDSVGIAGALVRLLDASGAQVGQTSTGTGGLFRLSAPAAGRYAVAVLRIGQRPWRSAALDLEAGAERRITLAVPDDPITLDAIRVEARSACRTSPAEGSVIGALLAEADRTLTLTRLAMGRWESGYIVERYVRTLTKLLTPIDSSGDIVAELVWPIRGVAAESLAAHGFVREEAPTPDQSLGGYTYYGLDAPVLLSPWFRATHCFGVAQGSGADSGTVVVTFRPEPGRRADIAGRLVLSARTMELRRVEWRYVRLPWWVTTAGAAGEVVLERMPSGAYIPSIWWMRAPVAEVNARREPIRIWGWREAGGRIVPPR